VRLALENLLEEQAEFTGIGESVIHVEQLIKEHKKLEEKGQVCFLCFCFILLEQSLWIMTDHG
jgi:hypothetical protein